MYFSSRRNLFHAVLASLVFHALALAGMLSVLPVHFDIQAKTIKVVFNTRSAESAEVMPPSLPLASKEKPPLHPANAHEPKVRQVIVEKTEIRQTPLEATTLLSRPVAAAAWTGGERSRQDSQALESPSPPLDGLNANDLRQYRLALAVSARRFKQYPALAREQGWVGSAEIELTIRAHLPQTGVALLRSSGHAVLDDQAKEMMSQAVNSTLLPESLKGRDFQLLLPVKFSLEDVQ
jgi:TonB family protein